MRIAAAVAEAQGGRPELGGQFADGVLVDIGVAGTCHTDLRCRSRSSFATAAVAPARDIVGSR